MVINKRSKFSRARGSWTHGGGSKKKRRGAGNRGGRGNAGSGKRGDARKPSSWKDKLKFGKHGFKMGKKPVYKTINIKIIEDNIKTYLKKGVAKEQGNQYILDIADLGYDKLLATGKCRLNMKITAKSASSKAIEKVKSAGGEVILPKADKKPEQPKE